MDKVDNKKRKTLDIDNYFPTLSEASESSYEDPDDSDWIPPSLNPRKKQRLNQNGDSKSRNGGQRKQRRKK